MKTMCLLFLTMSLGGVDAGDRIRSPFGVPQTPRAAIRAIPSAPLRLATGDI